VLSLGLPSCVTEETEETSPSGEGGSGGTVPAGGTSAGDPLCPIGQECVDYGDDGDLQCLLEDGEPAVLGTDCHGEQGIDCPGNSSCSFTNPEETESACMLNCGACPPDLSCADVTGESYLGCLEAGGIPSNATWGCGDDVPCSGNATCFSVSNSEENVCIQNCSACREDTCPGGYVCGASGICEKAPCTEGNCPDDEVCYQGICIPDIGPGPGAGPGPSCSLPPLLCTDGATACAELIQFDPTNLPTDSGYDPLLGYIDYAENGETASNQYRSWLRRDVVMAIQYAAAKTACKAADWTFGNGGPMGLIDMSEANGDIPGTSTGQPGHPQGTHVNGHDIDLAYFQVNTQDNRARPICEHTENGGDANHCTAPPHLLDPWRQAMFIGSLFEHPNLRVIGCDGQAGTMIDAAMQTLCDNGWLTACSSSKLTYEVTDQGYGWYYFHHHHIHVSFDAGSYFTGGGKPGKTECLIPGCGEKQLTDYLQSFGLQPPLLRRVK
jgi:hypothetical protein